MMVLIKRMIEKYANHSLLGYLKQISTTLFKFD